MWQTFPGHFLKKYEKFLKKDSNKVTVEAVVAAAVAPPASAIKTKPQSIYDDRFVDNKNTVANDKDEIHLTFEKIIPNKANWKKKKAKLKMTEAPLKGLTALASFPVSDCIR